MKKAAAISLVIVTVTLCAAFLMHRARREAAQAAQGAIQLVRQALNITPEVSIQSYVAYQKTSNIFELASVSKDFPVDYTYENTTLYSTKKLALHGDYTVKAGFDLRERFVLQIDEKTRKVRADFPAPKILSIQQNNLKTVQDNSGYWNLMTRENRDQAMKDMNDKARAAALEMKILDDARTSLRHQLLELARKAGQDWEITFRDETLPPAAREQ